MKRILILFFIIFCFCSMSCQAETKTMTINEFLSDNDSKRWEKLSLNDKGVVVYKDKVILNYKGVPLSDDTSFYDTELLIVIKAMKIKPRFGCNPKNIKKNGTLGCYIDNPDKK